MRIALLILLAIGVSNLTFAQSPVTAEQWQEDLDSLQQTIHTDYPFLFKKTTREDFDAAVADFRKDIPNMETHEIVVGFARIISSFKYGHTSVSWGSYEGVEYDRMPYYLKMFKDGLFIQATQQAYEKALGAQVLEVEGMPVEKALAAVKPAFPTENDEFFKAYGVNYLSNAQLLHAQGVTPRLKKNITLTLKKDGKTFQQTFAPRAGDEIPRQYTYVQEEGDWLDARDNSTDPLYLKNLDRIYYYEYLPEAKTVYVRQSQIQDDPQEDIPSFYKRVFTFVEENEVDKLILDVRLNGGGNNYKNKPVVTGVVQSKVNQPGHFFVITSGQTFSACQNLVNELDNYTEAIFVGQPTGENINFYGDNRTVVLPNSKLPVRLSFAWWQDKPQWENDQWLAPHISVEMTFEEYASNKDPVLDKILSLNLDEFIAAPMTYFTNLFTTGQIEQLKSEAARMAKDPLYTFFDFQGELNQAGYNLLANNQYQEAIFVFQMVSDLFPDSANAWDSLAEGYWRAGNKEKAREYYQKAISMDPEGPTGKHARDMLKQMEEHD
ncbi:MAG TPA: tetratricopeptide repeat protein [Saprospiraceae bacterium]|nr:tetratricopeptide repeat protein [Saprospiraceae bacterium]